MWEVAGIARVEHPVVRRKRPLGVEDVPRHVFPQLHNHEDDGTG